VREFLPAKSRVVTSPQEFAKIDEPSAITFVDRTTLSAPVLESTRGPIVAICEEPLQTAIAWMQQFPWLQHVVSASMLQTTIAREHFKNLLETLPDTRALNLKSWLGPETQGRRVRLTQASKRVARLERMMEFFQAYDVAPRSCDYLRDIAEELLTNAFYNAPVAAGAVPQPISRTQDVVLPPEHGCELAYGCGDQLAIVRLRDPFGSLSRRRLVEVLVRCAAKNGGVEVDGSMGGAGLGLWRVFANAAFVAISVSKGRHTEILVGVPKQPQLRRLKPFGVHLFFHQSARRRPWRWADPVMDEPASVTITSVDAI
jgi:hypothetical protein